MEPNTIYIVDHLRNWPWKRRAINPHYEQCKSESESWAENFHALSPKAQNAFNRCNLSLLAAMAYPKLNKDGFLVGCDVMNLVFLLDEWSEESNAAEAQHLGDTIMDALRNPHNIRPQGEWAGGELARQFWVNAIRTATPTAQQQFITIFQEYSNSVVQQSADRDQRHIHTVDSYMKTRRITIGAKPLIVINRVHMDIPDYVMSNEVIKRMHETLYDMLGIENDLYSYNVEQARGDDGFNLVTIVMHQLQLDVQSAFDWIGTFHDELAEKFLHDYNNLPSWGQEVDKGVAQYVDDLGNWVRANEQWSFESQRYFGTEGLRIMIERTFKLLPKKEYMSVKPDQQLRAPENAASGGNYSPSDVIPCV
ncbi:terpenoid synthase [Cyathus striatus]|nr:terpenoid synthase [Cyathus striatus]